MTMTRKQLIELGYRAMYASGDLHRFGYQIRHWFHPGTFEQAIEFIHRPVSGPARESVIVTCYDEQRQFHESIGAPIVPPGEYYNDLPRGCIQDWLY